MIILKRNKKIRQLPVKVNLLIFGVNKNKIQINFSKINQEEDNQYIKYYREIR